MLSNFNCCSYNSNYDSWHPIDVNSKFIHNWLYISIHFLNCYSISIRSIQDSYFALVSLEYVHCNLNSISYNFQLSSWTSSYLLYQSFHCLWTNMWIRSCFIHLSGKFVYWGHYWPICTQYFYIKHIRSNFNIKYCSTGKSKYNCERLCP